MKNRYLKFQVFKKYRVLYFLIMISIALFFILNNSYSIGQLDYQQYLSTLQMSEDETQQEMAESLNANQIVDYLEYKIKDSESYLEAGIYATGDSYQSIQNEITFHKYLLQHHIKPLNFLVDYNHISQINGATAMYTMVKEFVPLLIPLLSLFITMASVQSDKKMKQYLMGLPMHKKTQRSIQLSSSIIVSFMSILFLLLISFIIGSFKGGIGDFRYPICLHTSLITTTSLNSYMSLWLFILLSLLIILLQVTCYCAIGYIISMSLQNVFLQYFIGVILGVLPIVYVMIINPLPMGANQVVPLIPFVSQSIFSIITQGYSILSLGFYFLLLVGILFVGIYFYINKLVNEYA